MSLAVDEGHDFGTCRNLVAERAFDGRGDTNRAGLADATNGHAGVDRLDDDRDSLCVEFFDQQVGNRFGHSLLDLGTASDAFDYASEFAQADHFAIGKVADGGGGGGGGGPCP